MREFPKAPPLLACVLACVLALTAIDSRAESKIPVLQTYLGAALPPEQEVALKNPLMKCGLFTVCIRAVITKLDGHKLAKSDEYRLRPGKHALSFTVEMAGMYGFSDLWFVGEPGKTYSVKYVPNGNKYAILIIDDASGTPVGGFKGSSDEPPDTPPGE